MNEQIGALVSERLANVNTLLSGRRWLSFTRIDASDIALEKRECNNPTGVRVTWREGSFVRSWPCSDNWNLDHTAEAYQEDQTNTVFVRVTTSDDSGPVTFRYHIHGALTPAAQ